MPDKTRAREIRTALTAIAPLPEEGDVTAEQMVRHLAVRAQERGHKLLHPALEFDSQQLATMCAEFAAAHALAALLEADPKVAGWCAVQIRDAWDDGGSIGEWLWELLGDETCRLVQKLTDELIEERQ